MCSKPWGQQTALYKWRVGKKTQSNRGCLISLSWVGGDGWLLLLRPWETQLQMEHSSDSATCPAISPKLYGLLCTTGFPLSVCIRWELPMVGLLSCLLVLTNHSHGIVFKISLIHMWQMPPACLEAGGCLPWPCSATITLFICGMRL